MTKDFLLKIEGMDCPSCADTVEKGISTLPGVENVRVNFVTGQLKIGIASGGLDEAMVIRTVKNLGYNAKRTDQKTVDETPKFWFNTRRGKLVLFTGTFLVAAAILWFFEPEMAEYGFAAAALIALAPLAKRAFVSARMGLPFTIETLVTLAVVGAIIINESAEAAVVVFLFAVGEMLESLAVARARKNIQDLVSLKPKAAFLVIDETVKEVLAEALCVSDIVEVRPGDIIPADGEIIQGMTSLDESLITGESVPVNRGVGDTVYAGAINADGVIRLRVQKTSENNMISRILALVEEAEASKSPTARFIDRFSRYYTPGVLMVSFSIAVVPPFLFAADWMPWIYKGLAILLIGCPCALVLSTPAAITSGIAAGARRGLLIKGGVVLEAIGKVKTIAFDKTGTLTRGKPKVTDIEVFSGLEDDMLALAATIEATSSHPLAKAIVEMAEMRAIKFSQSKDVKALGGRGVQGTVSGSVIIIASPRYAEEISNIGKKQLSAFQKLERQGKTLCVVVKDNILLGVIAIRDELREDAKQAITTLKDLQVETVMLTGDNIRTGQAIAAQLGMAVEAEQMPDDKLMAIESLRKFGNVAMIGDGINDAPALARADVGIAMGGGTGVALETADAVLLREQVNGVPALVSLSRATMRNIYQNISVSLILKALFLVTTLIGATSLWMAILADTGATVLVTLNALRLLRYDPYE